MEKDHRIYPLKQIIQKIAEQYEKNNANELLDLFKIERQNQDIQKCVAILSILQAKKMTLPKDAQRVKEIYDNVMRCFEIMEEPMEGWRVEKFNKKGQCILSTKVISVGRVLIRFDGELEINIFNLAGMVYEVDLFHQWVPFCKQAQTIKTIPTASKIVKVSFDLPFINRRQCFMFGQGIDRIDRQNSVVIYTKGITQDQKQQSIHNISLKIGQKSVAIQVKYFVCQISIIRAGVYRFKAFSDVDLGVSFLPQFVLGFFTKKIGHWIFDKMINMANDISGTTLEKRIKQDNDGFYKWVQQRVDKFQKKST